MPRPVSLRGGLAILGAALSLALLAPALASEAPLIARVNGRLCAPVLEGSILSRWAGCRAPEPLNWKTLRRSGGAQILLEAPIPFSPEATDLDAVLLPPASPHYLGTDSLGRDVLSRVIHGFPVALVIGGTATVLSLILGLILGSAAGLGGAWLDAAITRLVDLMSCFPTLILAMALAASAQRPGLASMVLAIGLTRWTGMARLLRAEMLRQRVQAYCDAARALGTGPLRLILHHVLPNALAPVLVTAAFSLSHAVLLEAGLSFLGVGVPPGTASWGGILAEGQRLASPAWWLMLFPSLALFATVLGCNLMAEGVRDALDPRGVGLSSEGAALLRDPVFSRFLGSVKRRVRPRQ